MPIQISDGRKPLYLRIRDTLRERLVDGTWQEGDALPPRRALAVELGTTPVTLEKAISELVREGLLDVAVGSGTYVRSRDASGNSEAPRRFSSQKSVRLGIVFCFETSFVDDRGLAESDAYVGGLLGGIRSALAESENVSTTFLSIGDSDFRPLAERDIDAALIVAPSLHELLRLQRTALGMPVVILGASTDYLREAPAFPCIDSDNETGGRLAVEHLVGLGHRRTAIVCLSTENTNYHDRIRGYLAAMDQAGLAVEPRDMVLFPAGLDGDIERIVDEWVQKMAASGQRPTAVITCDLSSTLMVLKALRRVGLTVPGDISIVGFDDSPMFNHTDPQVTAVRQPLFQMGRQATQQLLGAVGAMGGPGEVGIDRLPVELIVRGSTASVTASSPR